MTFEPDTEETPVVFRVARSEGPGDSMAARITAVFPTIAADHDGRTMSCYAHLGQHGGCTWEWYHTTRAAKPEEYADLKRELESAPYGYRLKVYRRIQPAHRDTFRAELRRINANMRQASHAAEVRP